MKIALFNCNQRSVPPKKSGGIEKVISHLIDGFVSRGHSVTLFSTGDSVVKPGVELVSVLDKEIESRNLDDISKEYLNRSSSLELGKILIRRQQEFDIIHNHCVNAVLPIFPRIKIPLVTTLHEAITFEAIDRLNPMRHKNFVSISYSQRKPFPDLNYVGNIYHGIQPNDYPVPRQPENYLIFVGRISRQKNPHLAIQAAKRLGKKLIIIGKYKDSSLEHDYYKNIFLPCLKENARHVEWIGELGSDELYSVMNKAIASLHPVAFREPFGLAALESMACGCPPVAFARGAYKETIDDGKVGYVVEDLEEMVDKIKKIDVINRSYCRTYVEHYFSIDHMVEKYLLLYELLLTKQSRKFFSFFIRKDKPL